MARLTKGARALLDHIRADLAETRHYLREAHEYNRVRESDLSSAAISDALDRLAQLERRLGNDLEPMLERRGDAPAGVSQIQSLEARLTMMEDRLAAVEAQQKGITLLRKGS
jgi:DNA repair ATPase RecN